MYRIIYPIHTPENPGRFMPSLHPHHSVLRHVYKMVNIRTETDDMVKVNTRAE